MTKNLCTILLIALAAVSACRDLDTAGNCPVSTTVQNSWPVACSGRTRVDLLVVVDRSTSMERARMLLPGAIFGFINAMLFPLPASGTLPADSVNIAVIGADSGLAADGSPAQPSLPPECTGDSAEPPTFINDYIDADATLDIPLQVIPCDASGDQCPPGWVCEGMDTSGTGLCVDPTGDGTGVPCPPSPAQQEQSYVSAGTYGSYSPDETSIPMLAACLADAAPPGCDLPQGIKAAAAALAEDTSFMAEDSLLVVLVVSNRDDLSLADVAGFLATDEYRAYGLPAMNWIAGNHPDLLMSPEDLRQALFDVKATVSGMGRAMGTVMFAAITGVPPVPECQGRGTELADCLDHPDMQLQETVETDGTDSWPDYAPACELAANGETPGIRATPARRTTTLVSNFGTLGFQWSICNPDWTDYGAQLGRQVAASLAHFCFNRRLMWDASTSTSSCNAVLQFSGDGCPEGFAWAGQQQVGDADHPVTACVLPKIPVPFECADMSEVDRRALMDNGFGWFYCENGGEDYLDACCDGQDNDQDGKVDMEDEGCAACGNCNADGLNDYVRCPTDCRYEVTFTRSAIAEGARARGTFLQCLLPVEIDDPNCMEQGAQACNDGRDNNRNGRYDCHFVSPTDATEANPAHNPDPGCCPVEVTDDGTCRFDLDGDGVEDWKSSCAGDVRPDACQAAAELLPCTMP